MLRMPLTDLRRFADSLAFRVSAAPYLLLDSDLRIRAVNQAYERATLHHDREIAGEYMFDVFPDNPETPDAGSVANLASSFEAVLREARQHRMGLQRYDVLDPASGTFVERSWLPVNSPLRDAEGRVVAILHHVEDVTRRVHPTTMELALAAQAWSVVAPDDPLRSHASAEHLRRDADRRRQRADELLVRSGILLERVARATAPADGIRAPRPREP